ncbi:MAG: rhomboid family intramembrane serine protease [Muribaculaceae bacterium]|nr:rhomboid family intramembrane serine protease [Muribaculaceae bacterium]
MDTIKEYWHTWLWRDALTRLITINFLVWLACAVSQLFFNFDLSGIFELPARVSLSPINVLSMLTYMFVQTDFLHMFVNMMWLLLFGRLFTMTQSGERLAVLYIYGGLAGAVSFLIYHVHPYTIGASCSVLAVVGASALMLPKWRVNLMLLGRVEVIWLAVAAVVLFIITGGGSDQISAHTTGLAVGMIYALLLKRGIDITSPVVGLFRAIPIHIPIKATVKKRTMYKSDEEEFDSLLGKVSRSGYASLTAAERQRLFILSQKIKK